MMYRVSNLYIVSQAHDDDSYRKNVQFVIGKSSCSHEELKAIEEAKELKSKPLEMKFVQCDLLKCRTRVDEAEVRIHWNSAWSHCDIFHSRALDQLGVLWLPETEMGSRNWLLADLVLRELDLFEDTTKCINSRKVAALMTEYFTTDASLKNITLF